MPSYHSCHTSATAVTAAASLFWAYLGIWGVGLECGTHWVRLPFRASFSVGVFKWGKVCKKEIRESQHPILLWLVLEVHITFVGVDPFSRWNPGLIMTNNMRGMPAMPGQLATVFKRKSPQGRQAPQGGHKAPQGRQGKAGEPGTKFQRCDRIQCTEAQLRSIYCSSVDQLTM